ncbi:hypothetical protein CWE15_10260 [Aliidiomarina taiwanensis]|uniref:Uncharacterized protein n=1 Tax=Aliidiomarina taiwanensis TaxID=946228 RepID=A0A432WYJ2_9GAMM|nr:hypothetical protein [Aliidiomarina taiwanensis]RUO38880.1 hypothetical protein CWE15_10260 [Aliidiomarina taiwanensis]
MVDNKNKNWVFECLVKGDNDPVGFIAYSFYKKAKHEIAVKLREEGASEEEIRTRVQAHHDNAVKSQEILNTYVESATRFLVGITDKIEREISDKFNRKHEQQEREWLERKQKLESAAKKALDAEAKKLVAAARTYKNPKFREKALNWFLSGLSSLAASLFVAVVVGGLMWWVTPEQTKKEAIEALATSIVAPLSE